MKKEMITIVNGKDEIIGLEEKSKCHSINGILHRGFLVMVFNDKNQLLLARRSQEKKLWPNFWDGSIASHLHENETYEEATKRRLREELGVECNTKYLFKFHYNLTYKNVGSENEICAILFAKCNDNLSVNSEEISDWKFISIEQLKNDIKESDKYTPWLLITLKKIESEKLWKKLF